ncbi:unnamed protein product [Dibothriocephalus latus]|uniref:E3 ubiquitin-protein ligase n=1 Tax=Dibothriocephalus latus TaxID=60516 RepID=A0A3P7RF19_DIBLA|nr:unnamed protein product [Dibothriocephalus latus]
MEPRPEFSPFQRMLRVTGEIRYLLVSLLNMKPLAGENEECPEGWWDVGSRENFLAYFRRFLELLSYLQVASTDRTLLLSAIKEARDAFEDRVGVIDRCFRVKPFTRTQTDRAADRDNSGIENLTFQTLGATSEVYEYDVATMKTIAFCAQCSANLWVRNGLVIQNIMQNMFNNLRVEMVDRNYQLIQQAAAVLSPDELIVRMVHKLNLRDYLR